jgi:hypothetical protein
MISPDIQRSRIKYWRKNIGTGEECLKYTKEVLAWVKANKITTLLDYGSGKGLQYEKDFAKYIGVKRENIDLYDIGSIAHGKLPMAIYEGVIAINVFDLIPDDFIEFDLIELFRRTEHVFAIVPLTNRKIEWWDEVFCSFENQSTVIYTKGNKIVEKRIYYGNSRIG